MYTQKGTIVFRIPIYLKSTISVPTTPAACSGTVSSVKRSENCGVQNEIDIRVICPAAEITNLHQHPVHFLQNLEPLLLPFLTLLQREESLIHVLHDQLSEPVRTIMIRLLKQCCWRKDWKIYIVSGCRQHGQ